MRFEKIEIKNFRQFREVKIVFENNDHDLHFFIGENGAGKTNLLNAITWCLYGDEPHLGNQADAIRVNRNVLYEARETNHSLQISVVIDVISSKNHRVRFERKASVNIQNGSDERESFSVYKYDNENKQWMILSRKEDIEDERERWFPKKIRSYFFFDGEQLHNYINRTQNSAIMEVIRDISELNILSTISDNLDQIISKLRTKITKSTKNENLEKQHNEKKQAIENTDKEIENLTRQIENAKNRITELTRQIIGRENLKELEANKNRLEKNISRLNEEKESLFLSLCQFVRQMEVALSLYESAKFTLDLIVKKENSKAFPPAVDRSVLEKILKDKECKICGQKINDEQCQNVLKLLNQFQYANETVQVLNRIRTQLQKLKGNAEKYKIEKDGWLKKYKKKEEDLKENEKELVEVKEKLLSFENPEDIRNAINEREDLEKAKDEYLQRLGIEKANRDGFKQELDKIEQLIAQAAKKNDEAKRCNEQMDFVANAKKIVESTKNELMEETRKELEKNMQDYFNKLTWRNDQPRIELDEKYNLGAFNEFNENCIGILSAAERALVALSFTLALHRVTGFEFPLFIDTPVARVDAQHRKNFAEKIVEISKNKQLILTFISTEFDENIREIFTINAKTQLMLNREDSITKLESYNR